MGKLTEYVRAHSFDDNDILIKDGTNGTKKIHVEDVLKYIFEKLGDSSLTDSKKLANAKIVGDKLNQRVSMIDIQNGKLYVYTGDSDQPEEFKISTEDYEGLHLFYDTETNLLHIYDKNDLDIGDPVEIIGGGGGGSQSTVVFKTSNLSGWTQTTIPSGNRCEFKFNWSSLDEDVPTGNGTMYIFDSSTGANRGVFNNTPQGEITADLTPYLVNGTNSLSVRIVDAYDHQKTWRLTINYATVALSSTFDATRFYGSDIPFIYRATGGKSVAAEMNILVDGKQLAGYPTTIFLTGNSTSVTIPEQSYGSHTLEAYFTCTVGGEFVESNRLKYEFVSTSGETGDPIIISTYEDKSVSQYSTITIPYQVYSGNAMSDVTISVNGNIVAQVSVDTSVQNFTYRADKLGTLSIVITCGATSRTFNVEVEGSDIDVEPATDSLMLYLTSVGRNNSEPEGVDEWRYGDIVGRLTNFNHQSDGWLLDKDNLPVLRVSGDARVYIPYEPFSRTGDIQTTGKTIEIEFATHDVMNYDTPIVTCIDAAENSERGFSLTAQKAVYRSQNSEVSMQYKEDEHVRISFVIEKEAESRLIYVYVNGVMSGVAQYAQNYGDNFNQISPVGISIGSNDCAIDIYNIRVYDTDLTYKQVLTNWIADTPNVNLMLERYQRNNIYDEHGEITISNLPAGLPYMVITAAELPQFKKDKKTVLISFVDPLHPEKSFTATGVELDVQGTSSQYYPRKNYKAKFKSGFDLNDEDKTHVAKYALRDGEAETSVFCFKADMASSEGANNVELVRLYNDLSPYRTPAQIEDSGIRQGIDGFPMVIFWNDGMTTTFLGKYNFNHDKGSEEVYGFASGDESWEITNNNGLRPIFKSADFSGDGWLEDFEGRFPDGNEDPKNLKPFAEWLVSTDRSAATGAALATPYTDVDGNEHTVDDAAYRLAKFKTEFENYCEKDGMIFFYVFTEIFLMVDSRAKNMFPTFMGGDKWFSLPYDFDTAIGIEC